MNSSFSDNFAVVYHLNNGITNFCRGKNTVFNRTERVICKLQHRISRNFSRRTGRAYTLCGDCNFCIYGNILILRRQRSSVKNIRRCCCRSDQKACGNRTLRAVGGTVYNGNAVLTFLFRNISSRPAAVKVYSSNATCFKHYLRDFMHRASTGERLLATVEYHENDLTLSRYSDTGSAMSFRII